MHLTVLLGNSPQTMSGGGHPELCWSDTMNHKNILNSFSSIIYGDKKKNQNHSICRSFPVFASFGFECKSSSYKNLKKKESMQNIPGLWKPPCVRRSAYATESLAAAARSIGPLFHASRNFTRGPDSDGALWY